MKQKELETTDQVEPSTIHRHYRLYNETLISNDNKYGQSCRGGITVAALIYTDEDHRFDLAGNIIIRIGVAVCSERETFCKAEGRKKAYGRCRSQKAHIIQEPYLSSDDLKKFMAKLAIEYFIKSDKINHYNFNLFTGIKETNQIVMDL